MASGSDKRQRPHTVACRLSDDEREVLRANANKAGLAVGAFLRAVGTGNAGPRAQRRPPADHLALRQILGNLGRIGNNINQIARALNAGAQAHIPELPQALAALLEIRDAIFAALGMTPSSPPATTKPPSPPATKKPIAGKPAPPGHDHQGR
jgi:hypothetical protein